MALGGAQESSYAPIGRFGDEVSQGASNASLIPDRSLLHLVSRGAFGSRTEAQVSSSVGSLMDASGTEPTSDPTAPLAEVVLKEFITADVVF